MEIIKIVNVAIPLSDCPVKRSHEIWRREQLTKRINELISQAISNVLKEKRKDIY
jgi:hypothetical protein